jgi:hypothetical protein
MPARFAFVAAAFALAACATAPDYRPVSEPDEPVVRAGFSVLPPGGEGWVTPSKSPKDLAMFGKMDPEHAKQRGSVVVAAVGLQARQHDIATGPGLLAEVAAWARGPQGDRITLQAEQLELYRDDALATDCVRLNLAYQERGNPNYPGQTLAMPMWGRACRHPQVAGYFVQVSCSERRPVATPSLMTEALRAECGRTIDSLRFLPPPPSAAPRQGDGTGGAMKRDGRNRVCGHEHAGFPHSGECHPPQGI